MVEVDGTILELVVTMNPRHVRFACLVAAGRVLTSIQATKPAICWALVGIMPTSAQDADRVRGAAALIKLEGFVMVRGN